MHRLLRLRDVIQATGMSRSAIYDAIDRDEFPSQVKIGKQSVAWVQSEVDEWIAQRIERSRKVAA